MVKVKIENTEQNLNALDGSSVLNEVITEKIEAQRKSYKTAIKSAVLRNDKVQESVAKTNARAERTKAKLDALVEGGMEGYLAKEKELVDDEETYRLSPRFIGRDRDEL